MQPNADPVKQQMAINLWKGLEEYEPPILERIVAATYLFTGGEHVWIARIYNSLFWVIGGLALYGLARRMTSSGGGLAALAIYLFTPFSVAASRSFQPDPFMVMWMLLAAYSLYRWGEKQTWKWTILAGLFAGVAVLVKVFAAIMLGPAMIAIVLSVVGLRKVFINKQVWVMAVISITIPAIYYVVSIGGRSASFFSYWSMSFSDMLLKPRFYFAWLDTAGCLVGKGLIFFSLASFLLLPPKGRYLTLGLWFGYGIYGLLVPYQISTHDYYSLPIIPFVALSLAPILALIIDKAAQQSQLRRAFFAGIVILYVVFQAWLVRNVMVSTDYRLEAGGWAKIGDELPRDGGICALTHEYGLRLKYFGWISVDLWPYVADFNLGSLRNANQGQNQNDSFEQYFEAMTASHKYFLVTQFAELDAQPLLKQKLYDNYPIYKQGDGYVLFDLEHSISPAPSP
jgi:4-amino-4-deoxy-L-arabinose transferase-like glycosyltransferase